MRKWWDILSPFAAVLICMLLASMIGFMGFGVVTGYQGLDNTLALELFPWLSLVITFIGALLTVFVERKAIQMDRIRFGYDERRWKPLQYAAAAIAGAAAGHVWSCLIYASGLQRVFTGYEETASKAFEGQPLVLLLVTTVLAAPAAEELIFRFMIYRRAKAYFGILPAVLISSVLFGVYHANVIQGIYAFGFGLLLIFLYEKSGNILAPFLAHAGANLWAILLEECLYDFTQAHLLPLCLAEAAIAALTLMVTGTGNKK